MLVRGVASEEKKKKGRKKNQLLVAHITGPTVFTPVSDIFS